MTIRTVDEQTSGEDTLDSRHDPWLRFRRQPFERETLVQCGRWQKENIRLLLTGSAAHRALARKLQSCSDGAPCASEACLRCMYDFRTRLLNQAVSMCHFGEWTAVSIIPTKMRVPLGKLDSFDVKKNIRRLQKRIERSSNLSERLILGGLDISLNIDFRKHPYWQLHLYLLIQSKKTRELRLAVRQAFPKQIGVRIPYRFRTLVDRLEAIGYSYKCVFEHRHRYLSADLEPQLEYESIPDYAKPELLEFLDSYAIGGRMLLRGLRRHGQLLNLKPVPKRE